MASGLSLKSYGPPISPHHPITWFRLKPPSTSECQEGVPSLGGQQEEEHRVFLYIQVEHFHKKSQDHEPKYKIPGLVPVANLSGYINTCYKKVFFSKDFIILLHILIICIYGDILGLLQRLNYDVTNVTVGEI